MMIIIDDFYDNVTFFEWYAILVSFSTKDKTLKAASIALLYTL